MALPPRPESWNAGAGPDDDAANAGRHEHRGERETL